MKVPAKMYPDFSHIFWQVSAIAKSNLKVSRQSRLYGSCQKWVGSTKFESRWRQCLPVYPQDLLIWREYRPSTKIKVTPNDRRGFIRRWNDPLRICACVWIFLHGADQQSRIVDISVYPNPACDYIVAMPDRPDQDLFTIGPKCRKSNIICDIWSIVMVSG